MRNAVLFHGTGCSPDSYWFPYIKESLEKNDWRVSAPQLPNANMPNLEEWLDTALKENYTQDTVVIGHSAGCPLILSILENLNSKIKQAILVSGYARPKGENKDPEAILQESYNWKKIGDNAEDIIFLNSDNDPWGCTDIEGRYMLDQVGKGKLIVMKGEGHMGSDSFDQPYKEFPFLLNLID